MKRSVIIATFSLFLLQAALGQVRPLSTMVKPDNQVRNEIPVSFNYSLSVPSEKSVLVAVVASLILPGMGEWYAGSFESGKYHLIAEGGLWLAYTGFRTHANWIQQDAQTFAGQHAGANFDNKDDQYAVNIGNFLSTEEYNQAKLRDRQDDLVYVADPYQWQWDTDASRAQFKNLRIRSGEIRNNSKFIIGAIVINHLLSAFSAGKKAAAYNRSLSMGENIELQTYAINHGAYPDGVGLSITAKF
jgi:hypothetical protein